MYPTANPWSPPCGLQGLAQKNKNAYFSTATVTSLGRCCAKDTYHHESRRHSAGATADTHFPTATVIIETRVIKMQIFQTRQWRHWDIAMRRTHITMLAASTLQERLQIQIFQLRQWSLKPENDKASYNHADWRHSINRAIQARSIPPKKLKTDFFSRDRDAMNTMLWKSHDIRMAKHSPRADADADLTPATMRSLEQY